MSTDNGCMQVCCLQESLAKGLTVASRAVAARSTLPVLGNILVSASKAAGGAGGYLKLSATNLEIGITCWVEASVEVEGAVTVPARTFVDLINAMPPERVDMALDGRTQTLNVKCGRFNNNVRGIPAEEFPTLPSANGQPAIRIEPAVLGRAVGQVEFAAASDEKRPILTGVLAHFQDDGNGRAGQLTLAAADGFRMAVRTEPLSGQDVPRTAMIIPARAVGELSRLVKLGGAQFGPQESPVEVIALQNQVMFRFENIELISQLIDGNFPDYGQIVPKRHTTRVVANAGELVKAYKMAEVFARESNHMVKLAVVPGEGGAPGHISLASVSAETGDNAGTLDAIVEGEAVEVVLNARYVLDVLPVVSTPQVALELTAPTSPVALRPVGDDAYTYVMMPMHTGK